jgi:hypothetical protein
VTEEEKPKVDPWDAFESEVSHYFFHEPGVPSPGLDIEGRVTGYAEPKPPSFPTGADYYTMMTVLDRLAVADQIMPFVPGLYEIRTGFEKCEKCLTNPHPVLEPCRQGVPYDYQVKVRDLSPSCSQVLGAVYGSTACQWPTTYPEAIGLLERAKKAYQEAAKTVPFRKRPSKRKRLLARFQEVFHKAGNG